MDNQINAEKLALDAFYAMTAGTQTTQMEKEFFIRGFLSAIASMNTAIKKSELEVRDLYA